MNARSSLLLPTLVAAILAGLVPAAAQTPKPAPPAAASAAPATKPAARPTSTRRATKPAARPAARTPKLFLSWHAPYGTPGAATSNRAACSDSTRIDTLYLSFDPGKDAPGFVGVSGSLRFHAAGDAPLGDFWRARGGSLEGTPFRVIFDSDPERGFLTPWSEKGAGAPFFDHVGGVARLRIIYAIAKDSGPGVKAGRRYGFARVLVRRPPPGSDACGQPVCIEWHDGALGYDPKDQLVVETGERWVSLNPAEGHACGSVRAVTDVKTWKPATPK